ncbi:MAG: hypothetical protein PHQ86_04110 [Dehalococcoidales bacterium]|nr:hypothetical protein [Dehalococcoidales bacterium]
MATKKSSSIKGKIIDIEWKGDDYLSQELNLDYQLKDKLLLTDLKEIGDHITIYPEPKHEYARIRTTYIMPSPGLFEAIDLIARHIRSGW